MDISAKKISQPLSYVLAATVLAGTFTAGFFAGKAGERPEKIAVASAAKPQTRADLDEQIRVYQSSNLPEVAKTAAVAELTRQRDAMPR